MSAETTSAALHRQTLFVGAREYAQPYILALLGLALLLVLATNALQQRVNVSPAAMWEHQAGVYAAGVPASPWPAWLFRVSSDTPADGQASRLVLTEDGRTLGPPHTPVAQTAASGGGRYAHWEDAIYFSASDGSDPRTNRRVYAAHAPLEPQWLVWALAWLLAIGSAGAQVYLWRRALPGIWRSTRPLAQPALYALAGGAVFAWVWIDLVGVHESAPIPPATITHLSDYAYAAPVPAASGINAWLVRRSDEANPAMRPSTLLLEDGAHVGFPRAPMSMVQAAGAGRYYYGDGYVNFSTVDGSDPRTNGRDYSVRTKLVTPVWFRLSALLLIATAIGLALYQFRAYARQICKGLAALFALGAVAGLTSYANLFMVDEFVPRSSLAPSTETAYVVTHRQGIAPFIFAATPGDTPFYLTIGDQIVRCDSLPADRLSAEVACVRRLNGYQADFLPPGGGDPRVGEALYGVRYGVRVHYYLIALLLIAAGIAGFCAWRRPGLREIAMASSYGVAAIGALLLVANALGEALSLRRPDLAQQPGGFGVYDITLSYADAMRALERVEGESNAEYAERATLTIAAATLHAAPTGDLTTWRLHLPIWENWPLHMLGVLDPALRNYIFWDHHKALERGLGQCGPGSSILVGYLREQGIDARVVALGEHIVVTAETAPGEWQVFDPDYGVAIPHNMEAIQADPNLVVAAYTEWADLRPQLDEYTRSFAVTMIPAFYASAEDNSIDASGRMGYYSGLAASADAFIAREAVLYQIKWIAPLIALFLGLGVGLLVQRRWPQAHA